MSVTKKKILLITPSRIIARGITSILEEHGGFTVETVLTDLSRENEATVRDSMADIVIVDPIIFDFASRPAGRSRISDLTDAAVIAAPTAVTDDETIKSYDETISIYDTPAAVISKLRNSLAQSAGGPRTENREELSAREKEILVCHPPQEHHPQDRHQDRRRPDGLRPPEQPDRPGLGGIGNFAIFAANFPYEDETTADRRTYCSPPADRTSIYRCIK